MRPQAVLEKPGWMTSGLTRNLPRGLAFRALPHALSPPPPSCLVACAYAWARSRGGGVREARRPASDLHVN
jgi:hypothetical protein